MQLKYRLYPRRNGVFYWQDNESSKQGTLRTTSPSGQSRPLAFNQREKTYLDVRLRS